MKKIPVVVKILICFIFPPFIVLWIFFALVGGGAKATGELVKCIVDMSNNPSNETVKAYLDTRERIKVTVGDTLSQYEKNWPSIWHKVNSSSKVTTELKTKLRDHLMYSGKLYLNNPDVIDNYEAV